MPINSSISVFTSLVEKYGKHVEFVARRIEGVNHPGAFDDTLLHIASFAGQIGDVRDLLECGALIDSIGDLGNTPLHFAVLGRHLDIALYLLKRGADPSIANEYGETPFDVAQIARLSSMVVALAQAEAAVCSKSTCEASPVHLDAAARWDEFRKIQEMNFLDRSLIVGVRQGH